MRHRKLTGVLDAVYRLDTPDDEMWLTGIAEAASAAAPDDWHAFVASTGRAIPHDYELLARGRHDVDPKTWTAIEKLEGGAPPWARALMHRHTGAMTLSEWAGMLDATELSRSLVGDTIGRVGARDAFIVLGTDVSGRSLLLNAAMPEETTLHPQTRKLWQSVAIHFAAASRLRFALREGQTLEMLDGAEAVIEPGGKVVHATGPASEPDAIEVLREAVKAIDRARAGHVDPDEALSLWQGLFCGRWSVLETFDTDGRRYVVALENDPRVAEDRALTRRERQVVAMAALGQSDTDIAYGLGLGPSTVREHLRRGMAKMRIESRRILMQVALLLVGGDQEHDAIAAAAPFRPRC